MLIEFAQEMEYYLWLTGYFAAIVVIFYFFLRFILSTYCSVDQQALRGKHVLVTGGSSGIGKCVAIEAAKLGADVTLVARDLDKLKAAVDEIQKNSDQINQRIRSISLDLSANYEHIEKILNELENSAGPVHLLINCAGMAICGVLEDLSVKDIQHLVNLNFLGTVHTIKALLPKMKARHEGRIVITASQAALLGIYGLSIYSSTKFALRGLAESLHMEVKPFGIAVTLAMPPDTDTPGFENEEKSKPMATRVISQLGGLYQPETVAKQIIKDTLAGNFFSCVGFDSKVTSILCSGWSPPNSVLDVLLQSSIMGLLRIVSVFYHWYFGSVVRKYLHSHSRKND